ncbi:MAG: hypothetical protein JW795_23425, partial [Chitinivibrionales bacterium]|nr:hypothetical protein [Chitinivibrionales bacterium]
MKKHPLKKVSVFYIPLLATVVSISVLTAPLQAQTVTVPSADSAARDTSRAMQQSKPADSTASTAPQTTAS